MGRHLIAACLLAWSAAAVAGEPVCKQPNCLCTNCNAKCRCDSAAEANVEAFTTGGPVSPAGTRATVDLPATQQMRNTGGIGPRGPGTGAGLCVFTAVEVASRWQNVPSLAGLQQWMTTRPGGGWPDKLDEMLTQFSQEKGRLLPSYVQHTGGDEEFLTLAIRTGRMPAVTYAGNDGFYPSTIAHMVNLAHLDSTSAAILDNNRPGSWIWMSRGEFLSRWKANNGGWAVALLDPPPPPYPATASMSFEQCGPNGCVKPARLVIVPDDYRWIGPYSDDAIGDWYKLERNGEVLGYWDRRGWHRTTRPGFFEVEASGTPPVPPPAIDPVNANNYGVDTGRIHAAGKRYFLDGREVNRSQCLGALQSNLADDRGRFHLSAVGEPAFLMRFNAAVQALPADVREQLHVQAYPTGHWAATQFRLSPGVTLRTPDTDGDRQAGDVGTIVPAAFTEQALASLIDRGRNPKPAPAPSPEPTPPATPAKTPPTWWMIAAAIAIFYFFRRK